MIVTLCRSVLPRSLLVTIFFLSRPVLEYRHECSPIRHGPRQCALRFGSGCPRPHMALCRSWFVRLMRSCIYFVFVKCFLINSFISNVVTLALPSNTAFSFSSGLICRLLFASSRLFFLM